MTVDLTTIAVTIVGGILSLIGTALTYLINAHMQNKTAAITLANAVHNALGTMQQVAAGEIDAHHPSVRMNLPAPLASGVQYVLTHAGPEAARFGISQEDIADKIIAQKGLFALQIRPDTMPSTIPLATGPPDASVTHIVMPDNGGITLRPV